MTTLTTDSTAPRRSPTQLTSDMSSFILKELPETNSSIRCCDDDCFDPLNILHEIPTSKFPASNATAVVDLLDDDDNTIPIATAQGDTTPASTFLQEWEAFRTEFKQSTTYALAHSSAASLLPSLIDDADADDDRKVHESDDTTSTNYPNGLRRLRHSVRELEKLNIQLAKVLESYDTPAPCQPTLRAIANNLTHPRPCLEPPHDDTPQYVLTTALPPAPNPPVRLIHYPTPQSSQTTDRHPSTMHGTVLLKLPPTPPTLKTTIHNWARPAVLPPAAPSPMAGVFCTEKPNRPPPPPDRKTIPFKKKAQTKPAAENRKDFLRPP